MTSLLAVAVLAMEAATAAVPHASWITSGDYPAALISQRKEGRVDFEMTFDARGRLRACTIVKTSGDPLLDATACRLSRMRARANKGQPRVQTYQHTWIAPADPQAR